MTDYQRAKSGMGDLPVETPLAAQDRDESIGKFLSRFEAGRLPRDLRWEELLNELGKIAVIKTHSPDELSVRFGTSQEFFRIPSDRRVTLDDAARLRRLLHSSTTVKAEPLSAIHVRVVVVIDHHQARIYRVNSEGRDKLIAKANPDDPHGFHRHLIHRKEAHYSGERVPEDEAYFARIANDLSIADEIILIGHGKGKSNEAELLLQYLTGHNRLLAKRVLRIESMDLSALSEQEIEDRLRHELST